MSTESILPAVAVPDLDPSHPVPSGGHVLDVREQHEWDAGHVADALHIPLGDLPARVKELPEAPLLVACRSGGRSGQAVMWLRQFGYDATNLSGGLKAWEAAGLPLVRDDGTPGVAW